MLHHCNYSSLKAILGCERFAVPLIFYLCWISLATENLMKIMDPFPTSEKNVCTHTVLNVIFRELMNPMKPTHRPFPKHFISRESFMDSGMRNPFFCASTKQPLQFFVLAKVQWFSCSSLS